jgi:hypothetical protein
MEATLKAMTTRQQKEQTRLESELGDARCGAVLATDGIDSQKATNEDVDWWRTWHHRSHRR